MADVDSDEEQIVQNENATVGNENESNPSNSVTLQQFPESLMAFFSNPQFISLIAEKMKTSTVSPVSSLTNSNLTEITNQVSFDGNQKQVKLPTFVLPTIDVNDRLKGHSNFRTWKQRVERDILALGRSQFLQYPLGGENFTFSSEEKRMYDAQVMQYLEATLQNGPRTVITNESSAAAAFQKLVKMFGMNDIQKMVELLDNFGKIILYPKMNPITFVSKFENAIQQFQELGVPLDPKITVAYFLHKVRHIRPFMGFYTTVATLPEEMRTFEFVRNTFLDVANNQYVKSLENRSRAEGNSSEPPLKKEKFSNSSSSSFPKKEKPKNMSAGSPYTVDQLEKMKKMTADEKKAARCNKCGLLFHKAVACTNDGRFCFFCHKKGHEKKDCKKLQDLKSKN